MATKYLARTIIEGGRASFSKRDRNASHREERALARVFITKASAVPDGFDALSIEPRGQAYKAFSDKLGAPRRWLRKQVGRPWDKIRSEIFERFDPRTLAGQHIIFDHLLEEVVIGPRFERWHFYRLYVDAHGILRAPKPIERKPSSWSLELRSRKDLGWLAGRRVGGEGTSLFWLIKHSACDGCSHGRRGCCCPVIGNVTHHGAHTHYRPTERLTETEVARWLALHEKVRRDYGGPRGKSS